MADEQDMNPEEIARLQKENCIFCKLVSGDIPSKKVYEDADFVGILDINPATEGHVLLIPKQHFQILPQIPQNIVGNLGVACSKVSEKIIKSFKCDGTSIFIANGAVAGQRAPHFMVHLMPRKTGDDISLNPKLADIDDRLFNTVRERLLSSMKVSRPSSPEAGRSTNKTTEQKSKVRREELEKDDSEKNESEETEPDNYDEEAQEEDESTQKNASESEESEDASEYAEETELEEEHRLKRERDSKREKEKSKKTGESKKDTKKESKAQPEKREPTASEAHSSNRSNSIDFDKLSRLLK